MTATPIFDDMTTPRMIVVGAHKQPDRLWNMTLEEAFILLCIFTGAWTIGWKIGEFIGEKINAATGRDVPTG